MDIDENNGTLEEGDQQDGAHGRAVAALDVANARAGTNNAGQDINEDMLDETEQDERGAVWDSNYIRGALPAAWQPWINAQLTHGEYSNNERKDFNYVHHIGGDDIN